MDWGSALLRAPAGDGIVAGYSRLLRLLAGLNNGPGFGFLAGHIGATVDPDRLQELSGDPLMVLFRRRLREAGDADRDILRFLVMSDEQPDRRVDRSVLDALWKRDPAVEPIQNLADVLRAERTVSEIWIDGLEMPTLPKGEVSSEGGVPLSTTQLRDLLFGPKSGRSSTRSKGRWGEAGVPLNPDGIPLWCADLVPPKAELMKAANDLTWVPLAVLYGDVQAMPSWICAIAHVSKLKQLVNASVLRFLPSGCAAWEHEGLEVSLPACPEIFVPSPSMVANCVVKTEVPVVGGWTLYYYESKEAQITWPTVVSSDTPWRFFRSLALPEIVEYDYKAQQKESEVGIEEGYEAVADHSKKKKRKKRGKAD